MLLNIVDKKLTSINKTTLTFNNLETTELTAIKRCILSSLGVVSDSPRNISKIPPEIAMKENINKRT